MRLLGLVVVGMFCVSSCYAVEPGKPSATAVVALQFRMLATKIPNPELRNPDTFAARFLGTRERQVLTDSHQTIVADLDYRPAMEQLNEALRRVFLHVHARTRAIDDTVKQALDSGVTQMVILGAGYDSRAYRFQDQLARATIYEADFPPTQEYKKMRVREVLGSLPGNVVFVPIDFNTQVLAVELKKAGYRRTRKTLFIWEGVTMYIPAENVDSTLTFVSRDAAPGSWIVFDYVNDRVVTGNHHDAVLKDQITRLAKLGEPHVFGMPNGSAREFVEKRGLSVVSDLAAPEITARYLTAYDGTRIGEAPWHFGICIARVPQR